MKLCAKDWFSAQYHYRSHHSYEDDNNKQCDNLKRQRLQQQQTI